MMRRNTWKLWGYSSVAVVVGVLSCWESASAQAGAPRATRRSGTQPAAAVSTPPTAPQPLSPNAKITVDQHGLSIDVQEQDLPVVVERIAALGKIELRHPEGIPNRRISVRFASLPVVEGLKRLFRTADVPGYVLITAKQGDEVQVQRIVFLAEDSSGTAVAGRGAQRQPAVAAAPQLGPTPSIFGGVAPPGGGAPPPPAPVQPPTEEARQGDSGGSVFDDIKSNAAARRLLSQMMHPNEQVRERAFEGLVRLFREDEKQRALMELLEPLMEDLAAEDKGTQDGAREEIRKLLSR